LPAFLWALALHVPSARATLGEASSSVEDNRQHLAASRSVQKRPWGERHELLLPTGVVVREYIAPGGRVFAVSWSGPRIPDLRELLGGYFSELSRRGPGLGHHHARVTGADVVIQSSGHARFFAGRAWVPSLVPAGTEIGALLEAEEKP
jgi:hypothetical protein